MQSTLEFLFSMGTTNISEKWKFIIKKTMKLQLILSCSSFNQRLKSYNFNKLTSTEIYSTLTLKVQMQLCVTKRGKI